MRRWLAWMLTALVVAPSARAGIRTNDVAYKDGDVDLQGALVFDDSLGGKRPGVLVFHEWKGPTAYEFGRAEQLAGLGYVAFVADVYGKDVRPKNADEARVQATKYKSDRTRMRERANAALNALREQAQVDPNRIGAIGFCFGGTTALELARSGADDATMTPEVVASFLDGMKKSAADWQFVEYGGARHGFSNPANGNVPDSPVAYNERADRRAWAAMKEFLADVLGR